MQQQLWCASRLRCQWLQALSRLLSGTPLETSLWRSSLCVKLMHMSLAAAAVRCVDSMQMIFKPLRGFVSHSNPRSLAHVSVNVQSGSASGSKSNPSTQVKAVCHRDHCQCVIVTLSSMHSMASSFVRCMQVLSEWLTRSAAALCHVHNLCRQFRQCMQITCMTVQMLDVTHVQANCGCRCCTPCGTSQRPGTWVWLGPSYLRSVSTKLCMK